MLKTVEMSGAKKTKGIAVTYRAGGRDVYGTCPASCKMNCTGKGAQEIDAEYFDALLGAVPNKGQSFTYTHFPWHLWANKLKPDKTVVNFSADTLVSAAAASRAVPTVVVLPESEWDNRKKTSAPLFGRTNDRGDFIQTDRIPVVRCPAEYREGFTCRDCGNGEPLCARLDRNFIIGFTAHGAAKKKAADPDVKGGCYAAGGNVRLHWDATSNHHQPDETDGERLTRFVKGLPPRTILRHHVAGDIGAEK